MSFWVLTSPGKVLSRTTVQRVTNLELQVDENRTKCATFMAAIDQQVGGNDLAPNDKHGKLTYSDNCEDPKFDPVFTEEFGVTVNDPKANKADKDFTPDLYNDMSLNMELAFPRDGTKVQSGHAIKRMRDKDGLPIGTANDNPILDTHRC